MYYNGEMVRLRPPEREDLPLFVEWLSNPDLRKFVTIRYISLGLEEQWYERLLESTGQMPPGRLHFVIEAIDSAQPIGVISLEGINWCDRTSEVGIIVGDQAFWGKGYGTDAMRVLLRVGFDWYNLHRIDLRVIADNERAIRSYEKCGYQHEGRMREAMFVGGEHKDVLLMSMLEDEFRS
jgi:RimJ/RimL family protein N-acetyltransferase